MHPRLTIGIPTKDRPEHLQHAIDSCLKQTRPVCVVVADQGHSEGTDAVMARYRDHPHVEHRPTEATCLWENWRAAAEICDTDFFAWLQDDDTISRVFSDRVVKSFDAFPQALHWQASCYVSPDRIHAVRWGWNGPQVGVNMQDLVPEMWPGEYLVGSMYCLCWALAPGWAFRCGTEFDACLENIPSDCDLLTERLIPAEMGSRGPFIADPITAGYWHHHGQNESYKQCADGSAERQTRVFVDTLDKIVDRTPDWDAALSHWCRLRSATDVMNWLSDSAKQKTHPIMASRHSEGIREALRQSLDGRIEAVPDRHQNGVQGNGQSVGHEELVWR